MESELSKTMPEVRSIARGFPASQDAGVNAGAVIQAMENSGVELHRMAAQKIQARIRLNEVSHRINGELESALASTIKLTVAISELQQSNQSVLTASRQTNLEASTSIKTLLVVRAKMEQLRSIIQDVGAIDSKYRLNPVKDRVAGILDTIASQPLADKGLAARVKPFIQNVDSTLNGPSGMLALRAAVLTSPIDDRSKTGFEEKQKSVTAAIDELARLVAADIDPLELALGKANSAMNQATDLMTGASSVATATALVNGRARTLQALAWQLSAAADTPSVDRARNEIEQQCSQIGVGLQAIRSSLLHLNRPVEQRAAETAMAAFAGVRELMIGTSGAASAIRESLETQQQAERLFAASSESTRRLAMAGSDRARDAEGDEVKAVGRIENLAAWTFFLVSAVAFTVVAAGVVVGRRVRRDILQTETKQVANAEKMRRFLEKVRTGVRTIRLASRTLTAASETVSRNVEKIAEGAGQMQSSIREIGVNATEASKVGGGAASLVMSAETAVKDLKLVSSEIGKVTEVIRGIAFKTNLLALNAAVEAAHAGQLGAGFGVVADEVKNLAKSATLSTEEIDSQIAAMNLQVSRVIGSMDGVSGIISKIRGIQEAISTAVDEQSEATSQIAASIAETAKNCRGKTPGSGIHSMALELAGLAKDLESHCRSA